MRSIAYTAQCSIASPLGEILLARTARGLAGLWFEGQKYHPGTLEVPIDPDDELLRSAREQLGEHWLGRRTAFSIPLELHGTPFQRAVWSALLEVPLGLTRSYREIAELVRAPAAVRAVGAAVGRNPISIVVPCHRILGSSGSLTGYAGGLPRKQALLQLEGALPA